MPPVASTSWFDRSGRHSSSPAIRRPDFLDAIERADRRSASAVAEALIAIGALVWSGHATRYAVAVSAADPGTPRHSFRTENATHASRIAWEAASER